MNTQIISQLHAIKDLESAKGVSINIIQTPTDEEKEKILNRTIASIYIDKEDSEFDQYMEVSIYTKSGELLENVVPQEYITKTPQGIFVKKGKKLIDILIDKGLIGLIEMVILYVQTYFEEKEIIRQDTKSIFVFAF